MITKICNGRLLRQHQLLQEDLWIHNHQIVSPQPKADKIIDAKGHIVAPGYIDLQINGGFGIDFTSEPEKVGEVARRLPQYGVTSFLPTLISSTRSQYEKALPYLQPTNKPHQASMLGIHLEGPYFSLQRKGAHNPANILSSFETSPEEIYSSLEGVKMITLAPELPRATKTIQYLHSKGIVVSAGHTDASFSQMELAVQAGITLVTHLFNGMTPFHHRNPGVIGFTLTHSDLYFSIVADGIHVHPASLQLAWRANSDGLILISDAISALGLSNGGCQLGKQEVFVKDNRACIAGTDILAGSTISLDAAVRNFKKMTGCSSVQAIEAATLKPARVLGLEKKKGTLDIGADADIILLDDDLNVIEAYIFP